MEIHVDDDDRALIRRAAEARGQSSDSFIVDAARAAAVAAVLGQPIVVLDVDAFDAVADALDRSPDNDGFRRLMAIEPPWRQR